MATLLSLVKSGAPGANISQKSNDIIVKSKDREATKAKLESYFIKNKIQYKSEFKKSKSSSIDVLSVVGFKGDIIFKPIIQKGAGGVGFEKELSADLDNYFNGAEMGDIKHKDVIKKMESVLGINQKSKMKVSHEGSKNQKRALTYSSGKITISNSSGETLTDITLVDANNRNPIYLSLKMSNTYYILSAAIASYFSNKNTQVGINEYFGFNGQMMGGFGEEFACITDPPNYQRAKSNIKDLLTQAYGSNVVVVHKKREGDVMVSKVGSNVPVTIKNINEDSYVYPEAGKRKYANIKFNATINGHEYKVNFQFRGTTATDRGPKYLRILLERI